MLLTFKFGHRQRTLVVISMVFVVFLLLVLQLVSFLAHNRATPQSAVLSPSNSWHSKTGVTTKSGALNARSLGFRSGEKLNYEFFQSRSLRMAAVPPSNLTSSARGTASFDISLKQSGKFIISVLSEDEKGWVVSFRLQEAKFDTNGDQAPWSVSSSDLSHEMSGEIFAFINKSGRIDKMRTPATLPDVARNHWRDILAHWQVIVPENSNIKQWERTEDDSTGNYVASYSCNATDFPYRITKVKQHYLSIATSSQGKFVARNSVRGKTLIQMNPYPTTIEGHESLEVSGTGFALSLSSEASFSFHLNSVEHIPAGLQARNEIDTLGKPMGWTGDAPSVGAVLTGTNKLEGVHAAEEIAKLKLLAKNGLSSSPEGTRILDTLCSLMKMDSAAVDNAMDTLVADNPPSEISKALLGVLGAAGTPEAQSALLAIATDPEWPLDQRRMSLFTFAQVTEPIPEIDGWLKQMHGTDQELGGNALLILAAMGDRVRIADTSRFESLNNYILAASNSGNLSENDKFIILDAFGNLGPKEIPTLVQESLKSDDNVLRQKAIASLQRVPTQDAMNIIQGVISSDANENVRSAAVKLLADTDRTGGYEVLQQAALRDTSEGVRKQALVSLSAWADVNANAMDTIKQIAMDDASSGVRQLAGQLLESYKESKKETTAP